MADPLKKPGAITSNNTSGAPLQDKANEPRPSSPPSFPPLRPLGAPPPPKKPSRLSELTKLLPGSSTSRFRGKGKLLDTTGESYYSKKQSTSSPDFATGTGSVRSRPSYTMDNPHGNNQQKENITTSHRSSATQQEEASAPSSSAPGTGDRSAISRRIATMDELEGHLRANPSFPEVSGDRSRAATSSPSQTTTATRRFSAGDAITRAESSTDAQKRQSYPSAMKSKGSSTLKHVSFENLLGKRNSESSDDRRSFKDSNTSQSGYNTEYDEDAELEYLQQPRNFPFKHRGFPASLSVHELGKTARFNNKVAHPTSFDVSKPRSWHPPTDPAHITQNAVKKYMDSPDAHKRIVEHYDDDYNKVVTHAGGSIGTGEYDEFIHSLYGNKLHISEFPSNMRIYRQAERQEEPKIFHTGRWHDERLAREERQKYSPGRMSVAAEASRFMRQTGLRRKGTHLDDHYGRKRFKAKTRCRTWICLATFAVMVGLLAFGLYWAFKDKNKGEDSEPLKRDIMFHKVPEMNDVQRRHEIEMMIGHAIIAEHVGPAVTSVAPSSTAETSSESDNEISKKLRRSLGELKPDGSTGLLRKVVDSAAPSQTGKYFAPPTVPVPGSAQSARELFTDDVDTRGKPEDTKEPWLMEPYNRPNKIKRVDGRMKRAEAVSEAQEYPDAHDIEGPVILSPDLSIWKEYRASEDSITEYTRPTMNPRGLPEPTPPNFEALSPQTTTYSSNQYTPPPPPPPIVSSILPPAVSDTAPSSQRDENRATVQSNKRLDSATDTAHFTPAEQIAGPEHLYLESAASIGKSSVFKTTKDRASMILNRLFRRSNTRSPSESMPKRKNIQYIGTRRSRRSKRAGTRTLIAKTITSTSGSMSTVVTGVSWRVGRFALHHVTYEETPAPTITALTSPTQQPTADLVVFSTLAPIQTPPSNSSQYASTTSQEHSFAPGLAYSSYYNLLVNATAVKLIDPPAETARKSFHRTRKAWADLVSPHSRTRKSKYHTYKFQRHSILKIQVCNSTTGIGCMKKKQHHTCLFLGNNNKTSEFQIPAFLKESMPGIRRYTAPFMTMWALMGIMWLLRILIIRGFFREARRVADPHWSDRHVNQRVDWSDSAFNLFMERNPGLADRV